MNTFTQLTQYQIENDQHIVGGFIVEEISGI